MDKIFNWIRMELILHLDFNYFYPNIRIGWIWILIAFFFFHNFSYIFWGMVTIIAVYNFLNRM